MYSLLILTKSPDNKSNVEMYNMTSDNDMNMAIDMLSSLGHPLKYNGRTFWLNDEQANLLRSLGISFAKVHVKKWVSDSY